MSTICTEDRDTTGAACVGNCLLVARLDDDCLPRQRSWQPRGSRVRQIGINEMWWGGQLICARTPIIAPESPLSFKCDAGSGRLTGNQQLLEHLIVVRRMRI